MSISKVLVLIIINSSISIACYSQNVKIFVDKDDSRSDIEIINMNSKPYLERPDSTNKYPHTLMTVYQVVRQSSEHTESPEPEQVILLVSERVTPSPTRTRGRRVKSKNVSITARLRFRKKPRQYKPKLSKRVRCPRYQ